LCDLENVNELSNAANAPSFNPETAGSEDEDSCSNGGELTDLDSLLDDLYLAREELLKASHQNGERVSVSAASSTPGSSSISPNSTESSVKLQASRELGELMASLSMYKVAGSSAKESSRGLKNVCQYCQGLISGQVSCLRLADTIIILSEA